MTRAKISDQAKRLCAALQREGAAVVEVYSKQGVSVRTWLSREGAKTVGFVREDGLAIRAWTERGAMAFASWAPAPGLEEVVRVLAGQLRQTPSPDSVLPDLPAAFPLATGSVPSSRSRAPFAAGPGPRSASPGISMEVEGWDPEAARASALAVLEALRSGPADRAAIHLEGAWCEGGSSRTELTNSRGLGLAHEETAWHLAVAVSAAHEGDARRGYLGRRAGTPEELRPAHLLEEASWRTAACLGGSDAPRGRAAVLVDASLAGQLLAQLTPMLVASEANARALRESLRIGAPGLRIAEAGPRPGEPPWDGEGVARRAVPLIEDGRLCALLTDVSSAASLGLPRTGSARRISFRDRPAPAPTHLRLEAPEGGDEIDALLSRLAPGLFLTTARYFPGQEGASGLLVGGGILVNGGRVTGPARAVIPISPLAALARLQAVGAGSEWIEGVESGALLISAELL